MARTDAQATSANMVSRMPFCGLIFTWSLKSVALSETAVALGRFELRRMLRAVQEYKVTHVAMAPPVVVAMLKAIESEDYDLRSLEWVGCGGAPLGKNSIKSFTEEFPTVILA
ncbi:4-coumarate--CoA ligase-like 9 [Forsythia ovata]|uniref:4-coumarate--CoA ligase-like 9 n=1 Tax=Forsythia ovata TaxID=205694 RepID=A0ABD1PVB5_9LAMI